MGEIWNVEDPIVYAPNVLTSKDDSQGGKHGVWGIPALNLAIDGLNMVKEATSTTPVTPVFGSVAVLLTTIRVSFFLFCDEMCEAYTQPGHDGQRTGFC